MAGPLNISRSPQGQPVIFQAGDSEQGRDLGATLGEGIFTHAASIGPGQAFYTDIKTRAAAKGRNPDHLIRRTGTPGPGARARPARRRRRACAAVTRLRPGELSRAAGAAALRSGGDGMTLRGGGVVARGSGIADGVAAVIAEDGGRLRGGQHA